MGTRILSPSDGGADGIEAGFDDVSVIQHRDGDGRSVQRVVAPQSDEYVESIASVALPEPVDALADEYAAVFGERDRFLWQWIYSLLPAFTLSSVPDEHAETVRVQKTILTLFITLLDDLAEKRGDGRTFDAIRRSVCWGDTDGSSCPDVDAEVFSLAERLWSAFEAPIRDAPRYDQFGDVFEYDLRQALNAMDYTRLINERLSMANLAGVEHYGPHNMIMFPYADVDLMYSPGFDEAEFGTIRDLVWDLQKMARIGNWLTTWEREIQEDDYTAGVIVYAIREGIVSIEDVESDDPQRQAEAVRRIKDHGVEELFVEEWQRLYRSIMDRDIEAESVDIDAFVSGMETVMAHHMASRGHK